MFEVKVSGYEESQELIKEGWPTKIISLIGENIVLQGLHHLHVSFDDISKPIHGWVHPTEAHLAEVFEFSQHFTDDDRVLVHCHAGISRSTAIAIGILIQHGMAFEQAFAHIAKIRSILSPNRLIIRYLDEHFGLGGALVEMAHTHEQYPNLFYMQSLSLEE